MKHLDRDRALDLPSISLNMSSRELFGLWLNLREEHTGDRWLYDELERIDVQIDAGIPTEEDIGALIHEIVKYPNLDKIEDECMYLFQLCHQTKHTDLPVVQKLWERSFTSIDNPFHRAESLIQFVRSTRPTEETRLELWQTDSKKRVRDLAQKIRQEIPTSDIFLSELGANIRRVSIFCQVAREYGFVSEVEDLDAYIDDQLLVVDVHSFDGYALQCILNHLMHMPIDNEVKHTRLQMVVNQLKDNELDESARDSIFGAVVEGFLSIGEFDKAVNVWKQMKTRRVIEESISDFVQFGMEHDCLNQVRDLYPYYQDLKNRSQGDSHSDMWWNFRWHQAARRVANNGAYYFDEPEVEADLQERGVVMPLFGQLIESSARFPDQTKLRSHIRTMVEREIVNFNLGKLSTFDAKGLFQAILKMKKYANHFIYKQ